MKNCNFRGKLGKKGLLTISKIKDANPTMDLVQLKQVEKVVLASQTSLHSRFEPKNMTIIGKCSLKITFYRGNFF
jgi:hypothetical protein